MQFVLLVKKYIPPVVESCQNKDVHSMLDISQKGIQALKL